MIPKNIERRIRQHIQAKKHDFFAIVQPGFENTALNEISHIDIKVSNISVIKGGIEFNTGVNEVWKINYRSRCITRILMRIVRFKALHFNKFRDKVMSVPWELYLKPGIIPEFSIKCRHSKLYHTGRLKDECRKGITDRMNNVYAEKSLHKLSEIQTVFIRFENDLCTISIDTTGEPLYKRGVRKYITKAPIRETLASCLLYEAGIEKFNTVVDPMCGSGVIPLEAAFILNRIPAGVARKFAFEHWPCHRDNAFNNFKKTIFEKYKINTHEFNIYASDIDKRSVEITRYNFDTSGINGKINISCKDFFSLNRKDFPEGRLLIASNPPYGGRINIDDINKFYTRIGKKLQKDFSGSVCALVIPGSGVEKAFKISQIKRIPFINGGKRVLLLIGIC